MRGYDADCLELSLMLGRSSVTVGLSMSLLN